MIETVTDPETGETSEIDTGEVRITLPAGDRLGIRYDQAQALEAAWMRRALERLGAR